MSTINFDKQQVATLLKKNERRNQVVVFVIITMLVLIIAPFIIYPMSIMNVFCFALFAAAFNLLLGYTGLLSFGHAAFFGGAAYLTGHAMKEWGVTAEIGLLIGVVGAAVLGLIMGSIAIRRQGIYFAMVTLALSQMFYFVCLKAPFTHGEDGIQGIPRGYFLGLLNLDNPWGLYFFVSAILLVGLFIIWRIIHSPFGSILKSIRENESRAISLGISVNQYKLLCFIFSAALAGLAGSTKAIVFQSATLADVQWQMSGEVILMTLLGGIGTALGPVVGAGIIVSLKNWLMTSGLPIAIITGLVFMLGVLLFRRGIIGECNRLISTLKQRYQ